MKLSKHKAFVLNDNADSSWSLWKREIYYLYRMVVLLVTGLGLGISLLVLALGPYAVKYYTRFALPGYFTQWKLMLFNALPVMLLIVLCYTFIGRAWLSFGLGGGVFLCLSLANYYKLWFRDDPLFFEDILLVKEAKNMVSGGGYKLFADKFIFITVFGLAVGTILLYFVVPGKERGRIRRLIRFIVLSLIGSLLVPFYLDAKVYNTVGKFDYLNHASYTQRFIAHGFVYPFIYSINEYIDTPPEGYSISKAQELLASYEDTEIPDDKQINIIVVMREAYMDFSRFNIDGLKKDCNNLYHKLEMESYRGNLLTNAAYGGTVYTERNFLTGCNMLKNFRGNTNAYPWYFRSQGYTVEGSHPFYQWFYNRRNVNEYLGFENYRFFEDDYEKLSEARYPEDEVLFSEIYKDFVENKKVKNHIFLLMLLLQRMVRIRPMNMMAL